MSVNAFEKRRLERFDLELPANLKVVGDIRKGDDSFDLQTTDISSGGAFFYTDHPIPVGTEVKVDLMLSLEELKKLRGKHVRIMISGSVVRSDDCGMAVSFSDQYVITPVNIAGSSNGRKLRTG